MEAWKAIRHKDFCLNKLLLRDFPDKRHFHIRFAIVICFQSITGTLEFLPHIQPLFSEDFTLIFLITFIDVDDG